MTFSETTEKPLELINIAFYAPLKGLISDSFNLKNDHFGVDVLAAENEAIKASLGEQWFSLMDYRNRLFYCHSA